MLISFRNGFIRFAGLSLPDKCLLIKAVLTLAAIRLGLNILPLNKVHSLICSVFAGPAAGQFDSNPLLFERISWTVEAAGKLMPGHVSCLKKAMTAQSLLHRRGIESRILVGVIGNAEGAIRSHAWLESRSQIVIGASEDLATFKLLMILEEDGTINVPSN